MNSVTIKDKNSALGKEFKRSNYCLTLDYLYYTHVKESSNLHRVIFRFQGLSISSLHMHSNKKVHSYVNLFYNNSKCVLTDKNNYRGSCSRTVAQYNLEKFFWTIQHAFHMWHFHALNTSSFQVIWHPDILSFQVQTASFCNPYRILLWLCSRFFSRWPCYLHKYSSACTHIHLHTHKHACTQSFCSYTKCTHSQCRKISLFLLWSSQYLHLNLQVLIWQILEDILKDNCRSIKFYSKPTT